MSVVEELSDALAKDTIEASQKMDDPNLIDEVAEQLGALSSTAKEAFMTSVRVRLSEDRARKYLNAKIARAEKSPQS